MSKVPSLVLVPLAVCGLVLAFAPAVGAAETAPKTVPGADTFVYREMAPEPLRLHVFKPKGWSAEKPRPAFVWFFGGAWSRGTTEKSVGWARMAAGWGMVGIAPDYRTTERFGTSPAGAVADARAALRWVQEHAARLGIDPTRIVVGGNSAGGHLALWTAIEKAPPGSDPEQSPLVKPAALVLMSAAADTSDPLLTRRFGMNMAELSPLQHLDPRMPPVIMLHGDADRTVPHRQAVALHRALTETDNVCEFTTVPGGGHGFSSELPEWKDKSRALIKAFLQQQNLLPDPKG